jgi:thioester reductase-like protein
MLASKIFLTGATGFLGGELVKRILSKNTESEIWLLIRDSRRLKATDRLEELLLSIAEESELTIAAMRNRIHLVVGDLTQLRFGLDESAFQDIASQIDQIYHCAASIHLIGDLAPMRKVNYFGTQQVLELARISFKAGNFRRLNYISTAYIAGKRFGIIYENELAHNKGFCNTYEMVKHETEQMVEQAKAELPITIFRPSVIVGDSKTGKTTSFNVVYEPMRLNYLGKLKILPGSKKSILDVVPVDFVCDAIMALSAMDKEVIGKTFHLSMGENQGMNTRAFTSLCYHYAKELTKGKYDSPMPKVIHPLALMTLSRLMIFFTRGKKRRFYEKVLTYSNYGYYYKSFNNRETEALLRPLGIVPPKLSEYLNVLLDYALETEFGAKK